MIVAGVDIGNHTTEIVIAEVERGHVRWLEILLAPTGATKGTRRSVEAATRLLMEATQRPNLLVLPDVVPVTTSGVAVPIAHAAGGSLVALRSNGRTVGPAGYATGRLVPLEWLEEGPPAVPEPWIVVVPEDAEFDRAAARIAATIEDGHAVGAVACVADDAVVIGRRIPLPLPIIDEVEGLADLEPGLRAAVEVAPAGQTVQRLSDPFVVATAFGLKDATSIARVPATARSVMLVELGEPAGASAPPAVDLELDDGTVQRVDVFDLADVLGTRLTPGRVASISSDDPRVARLLDAIPPRPRDVFATDLPAPRHEWLSPGGRTVNLGLAGIGSAAADDVRTLLSDATGLPVEAIGSEVDAAARGAATTPGSDRSTAVCDVGAGTIDLARIGGPSTTAAGAGDLVTLALAAWARVPETVAELAKIHPVVEVLRPRLVLDEQGGRRWLERDAPAGAVGGLAVDTPEGLVVIPGRTLTLEGLVGARRRIKTEVIGANVARCLRAWPELPPRIALAGGGALDTELPECVRSAVPSGTSIGRANVAGQFGPRGAVATGAVQMWLGGSRPSG